MLTGTKLNESMTFWCRSLMRNAVPLSLAATPVPIPTPIPTATPLPLPPRTTSRSQMQVTLAGTHTHTHTLTDWMAYRTHEYGYCCLLSVVCCLTVWCLAFGVAVGNANGSKINLASKHVSAYVLLLLPLLRRRLRHPLSLARLMWAKTRSKAPIRRFLRAHASQKQEIGQRQMYTNNSVHWKLQNGESYIKCICQIVFIEHFSMTLLLYYIYYIIYVYTLVIKSFLSVFSLSAKNLK